MKSSIVTHKKKKRKENLVQFLLPSTTIRSGRGGILKSLFGVRSGFGGRKAISGVEFVMMGFESKFEYGVSEVLPEVTSSRCRQGGGYSMSCKSRKLVHACMLET